MLVLSSLPPSIQSWTQPMGLLTLSEGLPTSINPTLANPHRHARVLVCKGILDRPQLTVKISHRGKHGKRELSTLQQTRKRNKKEPERKHPKDQLLTVTSFL